MAGLQLGPPVGMQAASDDDSSSQKAVHVSLKDGEAPDMSEDSVRIIIQALVQNNVVLRQATKYPSAPEALLSQLGEGGVLQDSKKWSGIRDAIMTGGTLLGVGGYNAAYGFDLQILAGKLDENESQNLGELLPTGELVLRRSRVTSAVRVDKAVRELILSAYASRHLFGPRIYACWIDPAPQSVVYDQVTRKVTISRMDDKAVREADKTVFKSGLYDSLAVHVNYISEKWIGDVSAPLAATSFNARSFAESFNQLLRQSIDNRFWQTDSKPQNILYRYKPDGGLQLCWTDFDPLYCSVFPDEVNKKIAKCSVLVHAASFLGFVSCHMGTDVFNTYQPAIRKALITEFEVDTVSNPEMCTWLDSCVGWEGGGDELQKAKQKVSKALLAQMNYYIAKFYIPAGARCIEKTNEPRTFAQMLQFALEKEGGDEVKKGVLSLKRKL